MARAKSKITLEIEYNARVEPGADGLRFVVHNTLLEAQRLGETIAGLLPDMKPEGLIHSAKLVSVDEKLELVLEGEKDDVSKEG
jgi:hypothetical protein